MNTKHKPATPLPWHVGGIKPTRYPSYPIVSAHGPVIADVSISARGGSNVDAAYIVTACNAHPKLVAALKALHDAEEGIGETDRPHFVAIRALLRELGE